MSQFRQIDSQFLASPQITVADVAEAKALGVGLIVNNRPEDESDDQTPGAQIAQAAQAAGIAYVAIPVTHAGFSMPQVEALQQALAQAANGANPFEIAAKAAAGGYDISPIRAQVDILSARAGG